MSDPPRAEPEPRGPPLPGVQVGWSTHLGPLSGFTPLQSPVGALNPDAAQVAQVTFQRTIQLGPIPPAQSLKDYAEASPGADIWILEEAKKSADHTRRMEDSGMKLAVRDATLHRLLPFVLVLVLILSSTAIAIFANAVVGGIGFVSTLASVVLAYLKGVPGSTKAKSD